MKCDDFIAIIEEYIDGELDEREAAPLRTHLDDCAGCSSFFQSLKQEQMIYARYQRDIEVSPAIWAAVQSRLKEEPVQAVTPRPSLRELFAGLFATPRMSFAYTAALVLVSVGVTVAVMSYLQSGGKNDPVQFAEKSDPAGTTSPTGGQDQATGGGGNVVKPPQPNTNEGNKDANRDSEIAKVNRPKPKVVRQPQSPEQLVREAEQKYLSAIAILTRDADRWRSKLEPEVLAKFENAIASINRTIDETRSAARKNPDDPIALQYMLAAYSKKVELLREMARN